MSTNETAVNLGFNNRWSSFKHLQQIVYDVTLNKSSRHLHEFESLLKHHKSDFISLLNNPPPNALHKEAILNAYKDGIIIAQQNSRSKTVVPEMVVEEALVMSEMFHLDELVALELIITGSNQEPRYPGMSRGPIAVLLYYDTKLSLLSTLKLLVQSSSGRTWSSKVNRDVSLIIENLVKELKEGAVAQCLDQLLKYDKNVEFDVLQRNQALGPGKYKKQVYDLIKDIHQLYADIVYSFAAQKQLNTQEATKLVDVLARRSELDSNGCLDSPSTTLLMALLYTIDVSVIQSCDENDDIVQKLPAICEKNLLMDVYRAVMSKEFAVDEMPWLLTFAFAMSAKTLSVYPVNSVSCGDLEDEAVVDEAIERKVFESMHRLIASNPAVHSEEFFMRRIHTLISDFIALMPLKIKELREKGDEVGRIIAAYMAEGIHPPSALARHFEKFLFFIAEFYRYDAYGLSEDIWKSVAEDSHSQPKYIGFHKFIRSIIDSYLPQILHLPVLEVLTSFALHSPLSIYSLLKLNESNPNAQFSLNQFFTIFQNFLSALRGSSKPTGLPVSISSQMQRPFTNLSPIETDILCGILNLLASIVKNNRTCCSAIAENQRFSCISTLIGLLLCPIPRKVKASILIALAAFAKSSPSVALTIWSKMDTVFPKPAIAITSVVPSQHRGSYQGGISVEVEDIEPRNEEYPMTIAFLKALNSLLLHLNCNRQIHYQTSIESCVGFVINSIFLKATSRVYKFEKEKWLIKLYSLKVIHQVLSIFEPLSDGPVMKGAFSVMSQILQENILFRRMMEVVESVIVAIEPSSLVSTIGFKISNLIKKCIKVVLQIFNVVAQKEGDFLVAVHNIPGFPLAMLMKLASLFFDINPQTAVVDRLATMIRVLSLSPDIQIEVLKFLQHLISSEASVSQQILLQIKPFTRYHEDYFIHVFVECLESEEKTLRLETLKFILITLKKDITAFSSYGFSHRLLGFDLNKSNLCVPGPSGQTYTCFHAILGLLEAHDDASLTEERSLGLQIIHTLCVDQETCDTTLRFIRTSYDLLMRYLEALQRTLAMNPSGWLSESNSNEISWFWRLLAIELKSTAQNNLKSHANGYVKQLFGEKGKKKLTDLVPEDTFLHLHPETPCWEYFDPNELRKTIAECASANKSFIDVKLLHQKLLNEVKLVGPQLGAVQTGVIQNEIQKILAFVTDLNHSKELLNQKVNYFEGWRELTEVIMSVGSLDIYDHDIKARILLEMIEELLQRAASQSTTDVLLTPISSIILLCSTCIRKTKRDATIKTSLVATAKKIMNLLESSSSATLWSQHKRARVNFYGTLLHLYRMLPQHLLSDLRLNHRLLEKLCKDVLSGHEITKVLAVSILNETDMDWIADVASDGTLRLVIDSLLADDAEIQGSKFDEHCKSFYAFESKMALLIKIGSFSHGAKILLHFGIIDVLSNLKCFEIYPFLVGQSEICFKMFASVLRLLLCMCSSKNRHNAEQLQQFLNLKTPVINDILRTSSSMVDTQEGETILRLMTAVMSQLIPYSHTQVQKIYLSLINMFTDKIEPKKSEILANILFGHVQLAQNNGSQPLFNPSWNIQSGFANIGNPPLGTLVTIIDNSVESVNKAPTFVVIIELTLYLLWHHLNLYFTILEPEEMHKEDVDKLKMEAAGVVSDIFFFRVSNSLKGNNFVEALIRRIKTIILMRS